MKASIMMVTYNRLNLTQKTFETTLKNTGCNFDLIIIDNDSTDNTLEWINDNIKDYTVSYKIISLKKNMGIAYGRNLGLKINDDFFNNDFLCTLDNDVIINNNWLEKCCSILQANNKIGACGVNFEGTKYPITTIKINNERSEQIQIKPRGNLGTAAEVFKKEIHDQIGFFENYECYGHEDAMYGFKIRQLGKILVYLKEDGIHLGVEKEDSGNYREMKNQYWDINMKLFEKNIREYANKIKPLYLNFINYNKELER